METIVAYDGADGERPGAGQPLRLIGCETLEGGMVWLAPSGRTGAGPVAAKLTAKAA